MKKTRRKGTRKLDNSSIAAQTPLVKEFILAKAAILWKKSIVSQVQRQVEKKNSHSRVIQAQTGIQEQYYKTL